MWWGAFLKEPLTEPCEKLQRGVSQPSFLPAVSANGAAVTGGFTMWSPVLQSFSGFFVVPCTLSIVTLSSSAGNTAGFFQASCSASLPLQMSGWVKGGSFFSVRAPLETKEPVCNVNGAPLGNPGSRDQPLNLCCVCSSVSSHTNAQCCDNCPSRHTSFLSFFPGSSCVLPPVLYLFPSPHCPQDLSNNCFLSVATIRHGLTPAPQPSAKKEEGTANKSSFPVKALLDISL